MTKEIIQPKLLYVGDSGTGKKYKGQALDFWNFVEKQPLNANLSITRQTRLNDGTLLTATVRETLFHRCGEVLITPAPQPLEERIVSGFLFWKRDVNGNYITSPKFGGNRKDLIQTDSRGFIKIQEDVPYIAGYSYWTNGSTLLSWNSQVNTFYADSYYYLHDLIAVDNWLYRGGQKIAYVDGLIYAADIGRNIIAIATAGAGLGFNLVVFKKQFVNWTSPVVGKYLDWYSATLYNIGKIKTINISPDGTRMVIIAITQWVLDTGEYDYYEALIEFDIVKSGTDAAPVVTLVETSRITQYCYAPTVSTNVTMYLNAWYDKANVLKTERAININVDVDDFAHSYSYTIQTPYFSWAVSAQTDAGNTTRGLNTLGIAFRNNPYVKNQVLTHANISAAYTNPPYFDTSVTKSREDFLSKLTFAAMPNVAETVDFNDFAYYWPYYYDGWYGWSDARWARPGVYGIRPKASLFKQDDANDVLSDRFANKLYFYKHNGVKTFRGFTKGVDSFGTPIELKEINAQIETDITDAVYQIQDMIGVI